MKLRIAVSSGVKLLVALCALLVPAQFATAQDEEFRTLQFPSAAPLGMVYARAAEGNGFGVGEDWLRQWELVAPAQGNVRVKKTDQVRLDISKAASTNLSGLSLLDADALQALFLSDTDVTDEQIQFVGHLTGLRFLLLSHTPITDRAAQHLTGLKQLQWLGASPLFDKPGFGDEAMRIISRLPALETISMYRSNVTDEGLKFLADCKSLRAIHLSESTKISDAGIKSLAQLPRLKILDVGLEVSVINKPLLPITDEGLRAIGEMRSLTLLRISKTQITNNGLAALSNLQELESIDLSGTLVTSAGLNQLAALKSLTKISAHKLAGGPINDLGAERLAANKALEDIQADFEISDRGVAALSKLPNLKQLSLDGSRQPITDAALKSVGQIKALETLRLQNCQFTDEGIAQLKGLANLKQLEIAEIPRQQNRSSQLSNSIVRQIAECKSLEVLLLDLELIDQAGPQQLDLKPIAELPRLRRLSANGAASSTESLASLAGNTTIEAMNCGSGCPIDDVGAKHIGRLSSLKFLQIHDSTITSAGLTELMRLTKLEWLQLPGLVTDDDIMILAQPSRLTRVSIESPYVTATGIAELMKKNPTVTAFGRQYRVQGMYPLSASRLDTIFREGDRNRGALDALEYKLPAQLVLENWQNAGDGPVELANLRGKVVLVYFWNNRIGATHATLPEVKRLYPKYKAHGLEIVGVHSTENADGMANFVKTQSMTWPTAADVGGESKKAWAAKGYSDFYLIDRGGILRMADVSRLQIEQAICLLLAEKAGERTRQRFELKHRPAEQLIEMLHLSLGINARDLPKGQEQRLRDQRRELLERLSPPEADATTMLELAARLNAQKSKTSEPARNLNMISPVSQRFDAYFAASADHKTIFVEAPEREMDLIARAMEKLDVPQDE